MHPRPHPLRLLLRPLTAAHALARALVHTLARPAARTLERLRTGEHAADRLRRARSAALAYAARHYRKADRLRRRAQSHQTRADRVWTLLDS